MSLINNTLLKVVEDVVENDDKELVEIVYDIVNKINELQKGSKTSIAKLINDPKISIDAPLKQGKVSRYVKETCKKMDIKLEEKRDSFGGLAYFYEFKKC